MAAKKKPFLTYLKDSYNSETCPDGEGVINVLFKDERIAAKIYVSHKKVNAIDINNFPMEVVRRVVTSEFVEVETREKVLQKFKNNLSAANIVDYIIVEKILPTNILEMFMKDLFLGAFDYLATLGEAELKWGNYSSPKSFTAPEIHVDGLWNIIENRRNEFGKMAEQFNVGSHQVRNLTFKKTENASEAENQLEANFYSLANGEWSLLDFAKQFGMSLFLTAYEVKDLWLEGKLVLIYDSEFKLKPTETQMREHLKKLESFPQIPTSTESNHKSSPKIETILEELSYLEIKISEIKNKIAGLN